MTENIGAGDGTRTRSSTLQLVSVRLKSFVYNADCRRRHSLFQPVAAGVYQKSTKNDVLV
jgi:hypothetical protein